jgi:hypothetical protein
MAAAAYAVASATGSPLAAELLSGRLKIDEVPPGSLGGGEEAAYQAAGNKLKGDTLYLPKLDVGNLGHRGIIVHELSHAHDDLLAAGPRVRREQVDLGESTAYRTQARYLLDEIGGLSGAARSAAVNEAAGKWTELVAWAMALEVRGDPGRLEPIFRAIQRAARSGTRLRSALATWTLTASPGDLPTVEAAFLATIRNDYGILTPQQNAIIRDGLGGQSLLDWINRPL